MRLHRLSGVGPAAPWHQVHRILFLCDGNLCRSPFAEALFHGRLAGRRMTIESAGLQAALGDPSPPLARAVAARHGVSLEEHRSRPLTAEMVEAADLILVMDLGQRRRLLAAHPRAAGKVELLGAYDRDRLAPPEISDPMFGDDELFRQIYARIDVAVDGLLEALECAPRTESLTDRAPD